MTIREYLVREARRISDRALSEYSDAAAWRRLVGERRRQYMEMMGLEALPPDGQRPPLNPRVTGVVERPGYRIEKLYYESLPQLYVTATSPRGARRAVAPVSAVAFRRPVARQ